jgi:hypothetical protein
VDASKGAYVLTWPGDQVRSLLGGKEFWSGVWDLEVTEEGQSEPVTVVAGEITAQLDVTRT